MQPKAMAGVPDRPGYMAAEKDRYNVHMALGVPRPHKRNALTRKQKKRTATSSFPATSSLPATFTKPRPKIDVNGPHMYGGLYVPKGQNSISYYYDPCVTNGMSHIIYQLPHLPPQIAM